MARGGKDQIISYEDIDERFIIVEPYGTKGAYPSGIGATIIVSDIRYRILENGCKIEKSKEYVHRNSSFQVHAERELIAEIRDDIKELENDGKNVKQVDLNLVQNYSPCNQIKQRDCHGRVGTKPGCASDLIEFKQELKDSGKKVNITITFANFYEHYYPRNMEGLRELLDKGMKVKRLRGDKNWRTFINLDRLGLDHDEKQNLLAKARSPSRRKREKDDLKLWKEYVLKSLEASVEAVEVEMKKLSL